MAARPRSKPKHPNDPRGQFGAFLRDWIDRHEDGEATVARRLEISERAIRKWITGDAGPMFKDLDRVADALGFKDCAAMLAAVKAFKSKR